MKRKSQNITNKIWSVSAIVVILVVWQFTCSFGFVDSFMLPSPIQVLQAFIKEFPVLMEHSVVTLTEAFLVLVLGIVFGFLMAVLMDQFEPVYKAFYPLIVLTQTVATVAFAPL